MFISKTAVVLYALIISFAIAQQDCQSHQGADFTQGAYENVRVWIHPSVPEDASILKKLTDLLTEASPTLYDSVYQKAYFRSVRIVVPSTWSANPSYGTATAQDLNPDFVDFQLRPGNSTDRPTTVRLSAACGTEGDYVSIGLKTLDSKNLQLKSRQLVQSWAQYRYGVFPEYYDDQVEPDLDTNYPFDSTTCPSLTNDPTPTTCPHFGTSSGYYVDSQQRQCHPCDHYTHDPSKPHTVPPDCHEFKPSDISQSVTTSLMYTASENKIFRFCDDSNHNDNARNKHNSVCGGASIMTIIASDVDFDPACSPSPTSRPLQRNETYPSVKIVRNNDPRAFVYVLDVSGSMSSSTPERIEVLKRAVTGSLECMSLGERVGIVEFSSRGGSPARVVSSLTQLTNSSRVSLEQAVGKLQADGGTPIGSGILKGIEVLGAYSMGAKMLLVSDGEQTDDPRVQDPVVQQAIQRAGITIYTIAISEDGDTVLVELANQYGGIPFYLNPSSPDWKTALENAVAQMCYVTDPFESRESKVQVESKTVAVPASGATTEKTMIDASIGASTMFLFSNQDVSGNKLYVQVTSPTSKSISADKNDIPGASYTSTSYSVTVRVPDAEAGKWTYKVSLKPIVPAPLSQADIDARVERILSDGPRSSNDALIKQTLQQSSPNADTSVGVLISSQARAGKAAVVAQASFNRKNITDVRKTPQILFAKIASGESPVVNALVKARVATPTRAVIIELKDDGKGCDLVENDGTYSAYFSDYDKKAKGRYSATTTISDNADQAKIAQRDPTTGEITYISTGQFTRVVDNGLFEVNDPSLQPGTDVIPPARITDLYGVHTPCGPIRLDWTATGNDLAVGTAKSYRLAYSSNSRLLREHFNTSKFVASMPPPKPSGSSETITIKTAQLALKEGEIVYFALVAVDGASNQSPLSNLVSLTPRCPPAKITDFRIVHDMFETTADLEWTATGDDGNVGTASNHNLCVSISQAFSADVACYNSTTAPGKGGSLVPSAAGTKQEFSLDVTVRYTSKPQQLFFYIQAVDAIGNVGERSDVVNGTLTSKGSRAWAKSLLLPIICLYIALIN